ncbi:murein transglycosylase A [Desulfogranum japonicum]|uniref:murein transglycosylase A n=1 Tax=Desulfogranum japonicum TaxID=231447 RepID=UPI000683DB90|nr:MltA domain-containing protein [Desulfogranum japonicum]
MHRYVCFLFAVLLFCTCSIVSAEPRLHKVPLREWPELVDDLDYGGLIHALSISERYLQRQAGEKQLYVGEQTVTVDQLLQVNTLLKRLVARRLSAEQLRESIQRQCSLYRVAADTGNIHQRDILVTAYYQPILEGRLKADNEFRYPLYRIPDTLAQRGDGKIGRLQNGAFVSYWSRSEIEQQQKLVGQEIVWLKDPIDAFSLHIQGSGLIRLEDGSLRSIGYGNRNGHPYSSIGKYMVDTGRMQIEQASFDRIRHYLQEHPEQGEEILNHNASYIFFRWSDTIEAIGSMGEPVSAGRTLAADRTIYPLGVVGFLKARMPRIQHGRVIGFGEMHRFALVQDTGSAIKGAKRLDFFWGRGPEAGVAAGRVKQQGALYVLLPKNI